MTPSLLLPLVHSGRHGNLMNDHTRFGSGTPGQVPPDWQMPAGVDRALWSYAHEQRLADDEDAYFTGHPLLAADLPRVLKQLSAGSTVADLGCGTGRAALALAKAGHSVVAVDLSRPMLAKLQAQATSNKLPILSVEANLCDLRGLAPDQFDALLLLFSTLGMIRGREARQKALSEAARLAKPNGALFLHAHNLWNNLGDSSGRGWLLKNSLNLCLGRDKAGDRPMTYRGIPNLVVHQYRLGELRADLTQAGWRIESIEPLNAVTAERVPGPAVWARFRCGGWFIRARKNG